MHRRCSGPNINQIQTFRTSRRNLLAVIATKCKMEASNNIENVTVDFEAGVVLRDGGVCPFQKDVLLSASVYHRSRTDSSYQAHAINGLLRQHQDEILALRSAWYCNYCETETGGINDFCAYISGLENEVNGKIPVRLVLIPVCNQEECKLRAKQTLGTLLEGAAQASGMPQFKLSRAHVACGNCGKHEEPAGSFQKCSNCKVAFYCGRSCQVADWPAHKKACRSVSRSSTS